MVSRILFIGNSFTNRNDMPGMMTALAQAVTPPQRVATERVIANGAALKTHWERGIAREAIRDADWDFVVLQEQSTLPLKNRKRMHEYVTLFDQEIRQRGAKTALYLTWARRHEFHRQAELSDAYTSIGLALGATIVPVGVAWQRSINERPDLILHEKDNSHPNLAGSYLAACVFCAKLFGQNPVGHQTDQPNLSKFGNDAAQHLQKVAWETVEEFA
jgi:hypothetical protein